MASDRDATEQARAAPPSQIVLCDQDMPDEPEPVNVRQARKQLSKLDVTIPHSRSAKACGANTGKTFSLTVDEMKTAIARRRKHAEGLQYIRTWAEDKHTQGATMAEATRSQVAFADPFAGQWHPVGVAYAFWYDTNCKQNPRLALVASQGLRTAVANGGFREVLLLVYQGLSNVPHGVTIVDARQHLALQDFETLLNAGTRIQHLADLIRLRACAGRQQSEYTWLLDCDAIWLEMADPPRSSFGHVFASHGVNKGGLLNVASRRKFTTAVLEYGRQPNDFLRACMPCRFPPGSPVLEAILTELDAALAVPQGTPLFADDVEAIMSIIRENITAWGLEAAINDEEVFSPVPYYAWSRPLAKGTVTPCRSGHS